MKSCSFTKRHGWKDFSANCWEFDQPLLSKSKYRLTVFTATPISLNIGNSSGSIGLSNVKDRDTMRKNKTSHSNKTLTTWPCKKTAGSQFEIRVNLQSIYIKISVWECDLRTSIYTVYQIHSQWRKKSFEVQHQAVGLSIWDTLPVLSYFLPTILLMEEILHQLRLVVYPIIYRVL